MFSSIGRTPKFISTIFRIMELISATIVAGLLGRYLHYVHQARASRNGRIVYSIAIAGISIFFALVLILPMAYSFFAFPFDFLMFVAWIVAFGLLVNLVGGSGCHASWYWRNWGYYWGRWYRVVPVSGVTENQVGTVACGKWRSVLAWSFIGAMFWLFSFALGLYAFYRERTKDRRPTTTTTRREGYTAGGVDHNKEERYVSSGVEPTIGQREQANRQQGAVQTEQQYTSVQPEQQYTSVQSGQQYSTQPEQLQSVICPQCQAVTGHGSRFCNSCGAPQAIRQNDKETV